MSVRTTFRSDEDLDRRLRIAATVDGRSRSDAIRIAVEAYIASVARTKDAAAGAAAPESSPPGGQEGGSRCIMMKTLRSGLGSGPP